MKTRSLMMIASYVYIQQVKQPENLFSFLMAPQQAVYLSIYLLYDAPVHYANKISSSAMLVTTQNVVHSVAPGRRSFGHNDVPPRSPVSGVQKKKHRAPSDPPPAEAPNKMLRVEALTGTKRSILIADKRFSGVACMYISTYCIGTLCLAMDFP